MIVGTLCTAGQVTASRAIASARAGRQYMLALGRVAFLPVLAAIAPAAFVLVVQTIAAVRLLALSLRGVPRPATA